jgi:hypothetical protein
MLEDLIDVSFDNRSVQLVFVTNIDRDRHRPTDDDARSSAPRTVVVVAWSHVEMVPNRLRKLRIVLDEDDVLLRGGNVNGMNGRTTADAIAFTCNNKVSIEPECR